MAVILRNGTTRTARLTPLRSSIMKIAQDGLITEVKSGEGNTISAINLGYRGDNNVTRVYVELWRAASVFAANYEAALVLYSEKNRVSNTLEMTNDSTYFYVDLPEGVTVTSGNYQVYFVLKENISDAYAASGGIGSQDDPAYREVFISDSYKGVVNDSSGYSLIPDFNWDSQLYDYEKGVIRSIVWETVDASLRKYSTTVKLGGLVEGSTKDDIVIPQLDGVSSVTKDLTGIVLTLEATLEAGVSTNRLEEIEIHYPVVFSVASDFSNLLQKTPITVTHEASSIKTEGNKNLGMKLDAYITPIDVSGLKALPKNTKKYVIFSKDNYSCVCEAMDNICWIPLTVTGQPGMWQVSFVGKGTSEDGGTNFTYYTGVLKLPVVDNSLVQRDLITDSVYEAVVDEDGKYLYETNGYQIYAMGEETAELDYSATQINQAIGWAFGFSERKTVDDVVASIDLIESANENYERINSEVETVKSQITTITTDVANLQDADVEMNSKITELKEIVDNADVTLVEARVAQSEEKIEALEATASTHAAKISSLESKDTELSGKITTNENNINALQSKVSSLEISRTEIQADVSQNKGRIIVAEQNIDDLENQIARIDQVIEPYANYAQLINTEVARASAAETKIATDLANEVTRANGVETTLTNNLSTLTSVVNSNKTTIENALAGEIAEREAVGRRTTALETRTTVVENRTTTLESSVQSHNTRLGAIEGDSSIVRNDYVAGEPKTVVSKIVFLNSEQEYEDLKTNNAVVAGTLYLIREEEE
jgi:predicted  nucleic acid-binding Zn-ribbon protein